MSGQFEYYRKRPFSHQRSASRKPSPPPANKRAPVSQGSTYHYSIYPFALGGFHAIAGLRGFPGLAFDRVVTGVLLQ